MPLRASYYFHFIADQQAEFSEDPKRSLAVCQCVSLTLYRMLALDRLYDNAGARAYLQPA